MGNRLTCSMDGFSATLNEMFRDVVEATEKGMEGAVREACKVGSRSAKDHAREAQGSGDGLPYHRQGRHVTVGSEYVGGFSYKVARDGGNSSGTVGNSKKPGLVHLLEKGHARVGGGRVQSYRHIADAAEDAFEEMDRQVDKALREVLEG